MRRTTKADMCTERPLHFLLLQRALLHRPLPPLLLLAVPLAHASEGPAITFHPATRNPRGAETVSDLHEPMVGRCYGDGPVSTSVHSHMQTKVI